MDQHAEFAAFCRAQHPRLVGALTLYTGDADLAHDLTQETLARLWRDWRRVRTAARYFADLSVAQTAEVMGVPGNTVKTLTRRALQELRHLVDGADEEAFDAH